MRSPADRTLITTFRSRRAAQIAGDRRCREPRFDAELAQRLKRFRAGLPLLQEPIADNPYTVRSPAAQGSVRLHPAIMRPASLTAEGRA